ncbi:RING-H2 finger protein [Quillaja saponaria]|uniref:RING-H2 finger protein n=1 Tax=Quillaja saponaria TaxID=32244 RepID=A0AAD7Q4Y7_QUISA|nr:RING-H2 finger protein [Quillaja saponaria]
MDSVLHSSSGGNREEENINGVVYCIVFFVSFILLILFITLASYFCTPKPAVPTVRSDDQVDASINQRGVTIELQLHQTTDQNIHSCPDLVHTKPKFYSSSSTASCCCICLMDYKETELIRLLPDCGHVFHAKCIDPWFRMRLTCPMCRDSPVLSCSVMTIPSTTRP